MVTTDPYRPPLAIESAAAPLDVTEPPRSKQKVSTRVLAVGWLVVFALNMIVPLLFGTSFTREAGAIGMWGATALMLGLGWYACLRRPRIALRVIVGGAIIAATQFVPLLQIIAGSMGFRLAVRTGHATDRDGFAHEITSEFGGMLVTMVTGGVLLSVGLVIGWIVMAIIGATRRG